MSEKIKDTSWYHLGIKDWPEEERPREKLIKSGAHSLTDSELIALLLGSGINGVSAVGLAKRILVEYTDLSGLACVSVKELTRMKGVGEANCARLLAAFEIGRRIESGPSSKKMKINSPGDVYKIYAPLLRDKRMEIFKVILLNSGNRIIRDVIITQGTINSSIVHPREIFKTAIDHLAAGIILLHNHPSGEKKPSLEDKRVTEQVFKAGKMLDIPVLDHIIIVRDSYYSFVENRLVIEKG
ncbi:MAG: DNA repair protein RadC [bacterium]